MNKLSHESYEDFVKQFSIHVPENYNFAFNFLDVKASQSPNEIAMIHVSDDDETNNYDFKYFSQASSSLANALKDRGISKGDRVMLILYRRVEFWVSMLALQKIGAVAIPSPFLLTSKDIEYRVNFAKIKGIISENSVTGKINKIREKCPGLGLLVEVGGDKSTTGWEDYTAIMKDADSDFPRPENFASGEDPLLIFFSSGTTGNPKMVEHTHLYPLGHVTTGMYWHNLEPGDIHLTLADTGWGKALWGKFYGQWMAGARVFVYDFRGKFEPSKLLKIIAEHKLTSFCAPPTVYRFLLQETLSDYDLSHLKHCTTAGELLNESVFLTWKKLTGLPIYEGYGQTETTLQIATFPFMEPKPGSIGKPVPGWEITLFDAEDNPCPIGSEGEIRIKVKDKRILGFFTGYVEEPEKTADSFRNGYYCTGDKAWMDEDGYLWFLGRVDDLIKSSGYRIGPFEVESALVSHEAVLEAAVTGVPDEVRGQAVKATIVLNDGFEPSDALTKTLKDYVRETTAPYKYPRVIEYVDELPKTISGKIKRAEIRAKDNTRKKSL